MNKRDEPFFRNKNQSLTLTMQKWMKIRSKKTYKLANHKEARSDIFKQKGEMELDNTNSDTKAPKGKNEALQVPSHMQFETPDPYVSDMAK